MGKIYFIIGLIYRCRSHQETEFVHFVIDAGGDEWGGKSEGGRIYERDERTRVLIGTRIH